MSNSVFNIPVIRSQKAARMRSASSDNPEESPSHVGVINSGQGAITFAAVPTVITTIWLVLKSVTEEGSFVHQKLFAILLTAVFGGVIWWATAPAADGTNPKTRALSFLSGVANIFAMAATVIGLSAAVPTAGGANPPQAPAQPPVSDTGGK